MKSHEETDWRSVNDQQSWYDHIVGDHSNGFKFSHFQSFLSQTLYSYFAKFSPKDGNDQDHKFSSQQEMQLFRLFDSKNDHYIDRDEFAHMCQTWLDRTYRRACALVVVDVQNDFIDGSLALINGPAGEDGAEVVPVVNKLLKSCNFQMVAYTLDWHPNDHIAFHSNLHLRKYSTSSQVKKTNSGLNNESHERSPVDESTDGVANLNDNDQKYKLKKLSSPVKVFDVVYFDEGRMEQKLWPIHCVQDSWGAKLHQDLYQVPDAIYVEKGTLSHVDAYSAFWDNMHLNETGLRQELLSRRISDVFFCGLALDYCVSASALDSCRAGFVTYVIEDACRGIDKDEMMKRKKEMIASGVLIVNSKSVSSYILSNNKVKNWKSSLESGSVNLASNIADGNYEFQEDHTDGVSEFDLALIMSTCYKRAFASI